MSSPSTTVMLVIVVILLGAWKSGKLTRILNLAFEKG